VFLSHTSELGELPARQSFVDAAKQAVIDAGDGLVEMGSFGPRSSPPGSTSADMVAWADVYVGIVGLRYGSPVQERPALSHTELEYETAVRLDMERLIFLLDERSEDVPRPAGPPELDGRQRAFRSRLLRSGVTVATVSTPEELSRRLLRALYDLPDKAIPGDLSPRVLTDARRHLLRQVRSLVMEQERSRDRPIVVGLAERPSVVYRAYVRRILRRSGGPDQPLPRDEPIDALFRDSGGQLLVLGEPGAGKSSLLLELAGRLADDAARRPSERVPVVLHLATWAAGSGRGFDEWLLDELHRTYGLSAALSLHWIAEGRLALLLDGLDEVDRAHREACVDAINAFRRGRAQLPIAVCCRTSEFEALRTHLEFGTAIVILPLERLEVEDHLQAAGSSLAELRTALQRDDALWELLTTPLFLDIVAVAYRDRSPQEVNVSASLDELRATVLTAYVERMLERLEAELGNGHRRDDLLSRLRWLAGAMTARTLSVLHIDLIQPDWLPTISQRQAVTIGVSGAAGLLAGLLVVALLAAGAGLRLAPGLDPAHTLVAAVVAGSCVAIVSYQPDIEPTMEIGWSWLALRRSFPGLLRSSVAVSVVLGPVLGVVAALARQLGLDADLSPVLRPSPLVEGLIVAAETTGGCAGAGLVVALTAGITERYSIDPPGPGRAMRATGRSWLVSTLALGLPAAGLFLVTVDTLGARVLPGLAGGPQLPPSRAIDIVLLSLAAGALAGLAGGPVLSGSLPGRRPRLGRGLRVGAAAAAILAPAQLGVVLALGAFGVPVESTLVPGLLDWAVVAAAAALVVAVGGSVTLGVISGLVLVAVSGLVVAGRGAGLLDPGPVTVAFAVAIAFGSGLRRGGGAFLRHWALRWWLARDRLLPLDAVPFLELAAQLGLLRRQGGGYRFYHRLLQEHFARGTDPAA
jgi:Domain of unknown function (DUF4062)/NACHT domain